MVPQNLKFMILFYVLSYGLSRRRNDEIADGRDAKSSNDHDHNERSREQPTFNTFHIFRDLDFFAPAECLS